MLYIGYALLTVTVINWAVTIHDLRTIDQFTGEAAMTGLHRFGRPLLYALGATMLAALHRPAGVEAPPRADEGQPG